MLNLSRSDRIFETFLEIQENRIDNQEGLSAGTRKNRIRNLLKNRKAKRLAADEAFDVYQTDVERGAFDGTFLTWLVEHADEIIALIQKIMAMFGK